MNGNKVFCVLSLWEFEREKMSCFQQTNKQSRIFFLCYLYSDYPLDIGRKHLGRLDSVLKTQKICISELLLIKYQFDYSPARASWILYKQGFAIHH